MPTVELNADNFSEIVEGNEIVLVDFWAEWCGPCRRFGPIFDAAADENPDIIFAKVDTEAQPMLAGAFQILSIPTLMVFRENVVLYSQSGALPASMLNELIDQVRVVDMATVRSEIEQANAESAPESA